MQKPKGTRDWFDQEAKKFDFVVKKLMKISNNFGLDYIILPTFEFSEVFIKSTGEESDIVTKEIYSFTDKGGREIALRPEGTASTVRMLLENKLIYRNEQQRLFYIGPMFRYERPQHGRQREFYQYGVEIFNDKTNFIEFEIILLAKKILDELGIKSKLLINSIGSLETRKKYNEVLLSYLDKHFQDLSTESKVRFQKNPLRILDSKSETDKNILKNAPKIIDFLSKEELDAFKKLQVLLSDNNIEFKIDQNLVRGLDYYNDLVFEFYSEDTNLTLIGGGRYDNLVNQFDSKINVAAIGFAIGLERILEHINFDGDFIEKYYLATESKENIPYLLKAMKTLQDMNLNVRTDFINLKLKSIINNAKRGNFSKILIIQNQDLDIISIDLNLNSKIKTNILSLKEV